MTNATNVVVIQEGQPFQGCVGIRFGLPMPSIDGFGGQMTLWHVFGAEEEIGSRGDSDTAFLRIESTDLFEFLAKDSTSTFE